MRHRIIALLALISVILLMANGCSLTDIRKTEPAATTTAGTQVDVGSDLMSGISAEPYTVSGQPPDTEVSDDISRFDADLLIRSSSNKENVMVSPASVFLALSMTLNGARGETEAAMLKVLADQGLTTDQINTAARDWLHLLEKTDGKTSISIANSIWFRNGFSPSLSFLQHNATYYGAGARQLDFADAAAKDTINNWVKENTQGLIEAIVDQINPTTVMYLINTLYFKADWETPFLQHETRQRPFQAPNQTVTVDFMHRTDMVSYFNDDQVSGIVLPYDDTNFAYFAMLLPEGTDPSAWLAGQDAAVLFKQINTWISASEPTHMTLALPRYKVSYDDSLNNELESMGMAVAFGGQADFSGLREDGNSGLYISEVRHKTVINVDEKGTEAAAATSVAIDESAAWSELEMIFDRPFIYGIMDLQTGLPLFAGILKNPAGQ